MKKTIAILLVLTMVLSMIPLSGAFAATATTLYLKPNSNWTQANARFAAYFFDNGEKWVSMTDSDSDGIYEVTVPAGYPKVIFCRMNPGTTDNNWSNKWNQTNDLTIPTNGNDLFTLPNGEWDYSTSTWSKYVPVEVEYFVVGSGSIFGGDQWSPIAANKMEKQSDNSYKKVYTVTQDGTIKLKVHKPDGNGWYGAASGGDADGNFVVNATAGMTITVTFAGGTASVATEGGSVTPPPPAGPVYIIAGQSGLCGSEWNSNDTNNQLTDPDDDGTYSITFTSIAAGDYEFKITTDGSYPEGDNKKITVATAGDVTISYNPTSGNIQLSGATWYVPPVELDLTPGVFVVGNGSGNWINGKSWGDTWATDGDVNKMIANGKKFTITYENVAAGSYEFKFVVGKSWNDNFTMEWISSNVIVPGETVNAKHNNNHNTTFTTSALSDITLELDLTNYNHTSKEGATMKVTVTPVVYTFTVTPEGGTESEKTAFGEVPAATLTNQAVGSYTVKLYRNDVLADTKTVEVASANSSICIAHDASALTAYAQAHTYSVTVGSESKDLTYGNGKYTYTFENVAAGTYEYIIMRDGTADMGNVNVTVEKNNSKVIITFDPHSSTPVSYELTAPATEYYVAGIGGWDAKQNPMENNGDGTHTLTVNLAAGEYEMKVTDGTWNNAWPGNNLKFNVATAGDVIITFKANDKSITVSGAGEVPQTPNAYYVVGSGSIFTESWTYLEANKMTENSGIYTKTYTVTTAGTIELKVHNPSLGDNGWYGDSGNNFVINATEGMTITVTFANGTASVETAGGTQGGGTTPPPATEDTYHLVGSGSVFTQEWNVAGGFLLTKGNDGKYTKVFENVAAGELGFKVVKNNTTWIPDGMGNETKVTAKQGATVTVIFNPADNTITATAVGGTDPDDDNDDDDQGGGTVTPPASTYYVAGNSDLTGANWSANDSNNLMTAAGNKFSKTYTGLQPGKKYEFKITDGTWNNSWGIGDSKSDNYVFAVSAASSVTITFDPATKEISVTGDKLTDYVPEVTSATVVGSKGLCGGAADWAAENDGAMVKGTDGKFTKVFSNVAAGNYECKVLTNNGDWYPGSNVSVAVSANGSTVTITFDPAAGTVTASVQAPAGGDQDDDDDQGGTVTPPPATNDVYHVVGSGSIFAADWTIADADKMEKQSDGTYKKVYTGVAKGKLGIKVVKNNTTWIPDGFDNEIKAEVTADNSTVTVTYNPSTGKIDVKINNKDAGSASGTPEGGNQGGSQGGSTTVKEITIYAKVPASWTAPKVWAWKGTQNVATSAWPGNLNMTKGANGWWSIKITSDIEGVLICNESGSEQTTDVKVTTSGANIYITVGEKQADGKYAATSKFESVPSSGDETALFGMVIVMTAAVLGMGITVVNKKKFF